MSTRRDWSVVSAPETLVAGAAFQKAVQTARGLVPLYDVGPSLMEHEDQLGNSLVLDLSTEFPVLVVIDHDEPEEALTGEMVKNKLSLTTLPGMYGQNDDSAAYTGAARYDGSDWVSTLGVPGRVTAKLIDDTHLVGDAADALADYSGGEPEKLALTALLVALRGGEWDTDTVRAALHCEPHDDHDALSAVPDVSAAEAVLEKFTPTLLRAAELAD